MTREGTHLDEDLFCHVLAKYWGFQAADITILSDLTFKEIKEFLFEMATKTDFSDCDVFVCAVFTHGERNSLYSFDTLFHTSQMWKHFTDDECPSLKGKPKLFFIQACRGTNVDPGVKVKDPKNTKKSRNNKNLEDNVDSRMDELTLSSEEDISNFTVFDKQECSVRTEPTTNRQFRKTSENAIDQIEGLTEPYLFNPRKSKSIDRMSLEWNKNETETDFKPDDFSKAPAVHTDPDILVACSTADGYYSFRNPTFGSWFISTLHEVVTSNKGKNDDSNLLDILTQVNLQVSVDKESDTKLKQLKKQNKKKQVLCFQSTLTKRLYFTKKSDSS
uniref:Caspase family p20 domain-containing protein n=1 Tax=Strigamia maritima TaxID=126957 RepID=T1IJ66_STRMM